jgi:hypothetical protein
MFLGAACSGGGTGASSPGPDASSTATPFQGACGVQPVCPVLASSEKVVGPNRFLVGLLNNNDAPLARPDLALHIKFFDLSKSSSQPAFEKSFKWVWTVKPTEGLFEGDVNFDKAGPWGAEVGLKGKGVDETIRQQFTVTKSSGTPALGAKVPASNTATLKDAKSIKDISTDPHPDPNFYKVSIADALKKHRPLVVVFATPKFCQTQFCGPTLNKVKQVSKDFPNITFIHSEIYQGLSPTNANGQDNPVVDAVKEWGLPSEPWVFIVDKNGRLVQKYEVAFEPAELRRELEKL